MAIVKAISILAYILNGELAWNVSLLAEENTLSAITMAYYSLIWQYNITWPKKYQPDIMQINPYNGKPYWRGVISIFVYYMANGRNGQ